jgi:hypothetical protein
VGHIRGKMGRAPCALWAERRRERGCIGAKPCGQGWAAGEEKKGPIKGERKRAGLKERESWVGLRKGERKRGS